MYKSHLWAILGVCVLLLAAACGGGEEAPSTGGETESAESTPAAEAGEVGSISGTIQYTGDEDPDTVIDMGADPNCAALHDEPVYTQAVVTDDDGNLANVFVYVKSGLKRSFSPPAEPVVLNQEGCRYTPHVFGVQTGQTFVIRNSDETLHNVHATPNANEEFNQGQPFQNMEMEKTFDKVEVMVPFKCDVHPWMSAYAGVLDHPFFAVTGEDGSFTIENLPAGTYMVEAWHEQFGTRSMEVTITADEESEFSLDYAADPA